MIDKSLIKVCGRNLIEHQIIKLLGIFEKVFISCKDNYRKIEHLYSKRIILFRDIFNIKHPLSGIVTASLYLQGRYSHVFVLPVDLPLISQPFISYMLSLVDHKTDVVIPRWRRGYVEPLVSVYRIGLVLRFLKDNPPSMWDKVPVRFILRYCSNIRYISAEDVVEKFGNVFLNINTLSQLKDIERIECI